MKRKDFIQKSVGALLIGIPTVSLVACSSSADDGSNNQNQPPSGNANCLENGTASSISSNHGHNLTVSKADVQAGAAKTYSIQGSSGHNHNVTISADDFASLQNNESISVQSTSGGGHTHSVTVRCA